MVSSAARVGSISVLLQTDVAGGVRGLNAFATATERTGQQVSRSVIGIDRSVGSLNRTLSGINARGFTGLTVGALRANLSLEQMKGLLLATTALLGGLVPAALGAGLIRIADRAHLLSNNLRTVTTSTEDLKSTQESLFQVAQRTRSSYEATATIYARTARATEHLSMSQEKLLRLTETVQKSFAIGGASTTEAQGAAIQLSQGIASDRFSGDEFRSVAENAPVLLRGIADSLGVNIGKLREMAHAGQLTAKVVTQAIIDASARIDEEFARTTSTIGQAMVKLDNAVLKFVGDSENVSVASGAIVTAINAISENIDTTADALLLLAGFAVSAFAGRPLNALKQNTAAMGAHLAAVRASSAATLQQAQADAVANAQRLASAKAYYMMVTQGVATEATRVKASRELHSANIANLASQKALTMATAQHAAALNAALASGRLFAATGRAASAAWAFIGGPFGLALMALGAAFYVVSSESAKAEAELARFAAAADNAQQQLAAIEGRAKGAGNEVERLAAGFRDLIKVEGFARAQAEVNALKDTLADMGRQLGELARQVSSAGGSVALGVQITELTSKFRVGAISAEAYAEKLQDIARANPDLSSLAADMADLSEEIASANPKLEEMNRQLDEMNGKEVNVKIRFIPEGLTDGGRAVKGNRPGASPMDLAASDAAQAKALAGRIGWDEFFDFPKEKAARKPSTRKDAEDRFAESIQNVRDRIAALREEQAAIGLSYREQERRSKALELEQEALKQAREEARRKGEQDWQNAELTATQVSLIAQVSEAYAAEADQLRLLQEQQRAMADLAQEIGTALGDAFKSFTKDVLDGKSATEALSNALNNLGDRFLSKGIDMVFDGILGLLTGGFGGFKGIFDSGGVVLGGNVVPFGPKTKALGSGVLGDSGFGPRHFPAVLEYGETVLDKAMSQDSMDVMAGLAGAVENMGGGEVASTFAPVYHIDARGAQRGVGEEIAAALTAYDKGRVARLARDLPELKKRTGTR